MAITISVINNKGGVGKTTSTGILAELLAYLGKKTLVVDIDHQGNLSMLFHAHKEDSPGLIEGRELPEEENISELFKFRYREPAQVKGLIKHTPIPNLDIIPSSKRHKHTQEAILKNTGNNNIILKRALVAVSKDYDFILIDNAPADDILIVNSMFASDHIIIPVRVEDFSYKGLKETLDSIAYIREEHEVDTDFLGAFITQAELNTNSFKRKKSQYMEELGNKFFETPIRKDIKISEIESDFEPILKHNAGSNVVFDYANLLLELDILDSDTTKLLKESIGDEINEEIKMTIEEVDENSTLNRLSAYANKIQS